MASTDPTSPRVAFCGPDEPWITELVLDMEAAGYSVTHADFSELEYILSNGSQPDVIIHSDHIKYHDILSLLEDVKSTGQRPLLVTITSGNPVTPTTDQLIFPPEPAFVVNHLASYLQLRRENAELTARLEKLTHAQQNTTNEVELLRDAVVYNVAHELRTPLLQIKAAVSLLSETMEGDLDIIQLAKSATTRLEVLVKNITMLNSSLDINIGPAIARDTIQYAIRNLGRVWNQKDAIKRIELEIEDNLPPIMADKTGLSIVIQLLTDNALKFSNDTVIVSARAHKESVAIAVTDFGIGIPSDQIERIFEPFYQIDASSTRIAGGPGIGLSLVRLILNKHGSSIEVSSQPNKGSQFSFHLPVANLRSS